MRNLSPVMVALLATIGVLFLLLRQPAAGVSGDTVADRVFGQGGSFTTGDCNLGGISGSSLCNAQGLFVDGSGNVYVVDLINRRVLEYDSPLTTDTVADRVFGQGGSFTTVTASGCADVLISASSLCDPTDVAVDGSGNVYINDVSRSRILEYDSPLTTDTVADRVFGQGGSFTTGDCNLGGISASSLCQPQGLAVDGSGNLYVADLVNHRVLEYGSPLTTDTVADRGFGQGGSFTTVTANGCADALISASSLCDPNGVAVDGSGNVYINDVSRSRTLEYDSPLTTDTLADRVFGQGGSFTTGDCNLGGISASSLCNPVGLGVDGLGNLYVADTINHRVLEYSSPLTTDTVADRVFGQGGSFTTNTPNGCADALISASSLCDPTVVAVDGSGNVYINDVSRSRILEYDSPLATPTPSPSPTPTPTPPPTLSPTPTPTTSPTGTPSPTPTASSAHTPTSTPTPTATPTPTQTPTHTPTATATHTHTATPTPTPTLPSITLTSTGEPTPTPTPTATPGTTSGDIDCDGNVDSVDALKILRHVAGLPLNLPPGCTFDGDVDCDSDADSVDALRILRYVAGLPNNLPSGCPPIGPPRK